MATLLCLGEFDAKEIERGGGEQLDDVWLVSGYRFDLRISDRHIASFGHGYFVEYDGFANNFAIVEIFKAVDFAVAGRDILFHVHDHGAFSAVGEGGACSNDTVAPHFSHVHASAPHGVVVADQGGEHLVGLSGYSVAGCCR